MKLVIDTGVILAFVNSEQDKGMEHLERFFRSIKSRKHITFISTITISEIFAVFSRIGEAKKAVETIVSLKEIGISIIDVNEAIAKDAGIFKSKYSTSKKGFSYADAIILSTALSSKCDGLLTYDSEFDSVSEIRILKPENI